MSKAPKQAETELVSVASIMRSPAFLRGVEEYRARKRPDFDQENNWQYERGRQWAAIAPRDLAITTPSGRLNRKALAIFERNIP
jgi:hypothetical protein